MMRALGVGVFVAIAVAGVLLDQHSRRGKNPAPSFTQLIDWLEARAVGRLALFVGWGFTGWHFFVR